MQVLNALPSASSANLDNFLTEGAEQINYTAQAWKPDGPEIDGLCG
jgi:hypothetical protein